METLTVGLGERSYPVLIEENLLDLIGADLAGRKIARRFAVITDETVAALYGDRLVASLERGGLSAQLFAFAPGEAQKTLATLGSLASRLASAGFDRSSAIIGFGGGVPGDIAGYLAASWMRGVPFVQIPTTLLAQVDSSVGGKTGLDLPEGKNLLGAFYQPKAVYIDTATLATLAHDELLGGLAEVIKYGVIRDRRFFDHLRRQRQQILALKPAVIAGVVARCCAIKAEVVALDEREGGLRRILNYGHTIGHAVEGASGYSLIHGLAVAIGMVAAARLAVMQNLLAEELCAEIVDLLRDYSLPVEIPAGISPETIRRYLLTDKKSVDGRLFFVLPTTIGATTITDAVSRAQIDRVLG